MEGATLGPYRIDRELGAGGMGKVYAASVVGRAPGIPDGARVALKIVHPHLLDAPGFFKRFMREAEIGKAVVHENVVRTFDCDAVGGRHFLVMEYVEGQTLRSLLAELDRVPEELCRHVGREIAKGLAAIHAAGVVHRDMKPENVLVTKEHVVKVMDLGVARLADEAVRLSQSGAFVGSIQYAAPEQFAKGGVDVDARADLHALGLILYELATAQHPYQADDFRTVMRRVLDEKPRRPAEINPQLSPFFEELVLQLLAKDRGARFATAAELARILDEGEKSAWWKERAKAIRVETKRPLRRIRVPRETALYGRDVELAKLGALFEKAKAGEGQVVLIDGEAGIGKSRLVDEFVGRLVQSGEDVNFLFGSYPPGGAATASGAFSTAYREQFGDADLVETLKAYLTVTPILVPAFAALLRGETTPTGVEPLTKDSLQTVFVHATRALAAERTTIVLIDDLHFAPEEGRALFAALAMAVPGHRVLLVGTTRPGIDEKWSSSLDRVGASRMALHRLGAKDLLRLLGDSLRSERLAEELAGKVAAKSDGNPFFVFEILRGLREGQFLTRKDDGTWVSTRVIADIQIPSSVLELVQARVADLSQDERNALDVASCLGFEFDPSLVAAVLGVGRIPLLQRLAHVEKAHRLVRSSGRRFVFDHHQVQEALYGGLPEMLREEYHAAIGDAVETASGAAAKEPKDLDGALCVDLAEHFLKGAQGAKALRYLDAALTHLEKGYLNGAAIRLADRALELPGLLGGEERLWVLLHLGGEDGPLDRLGLRTRRESVAREATTLADAESNDRLRGRVALMLGLVLRDTSRYDEAEACFRRALDLGRATADGLAEARAIWKLGLVHEHRGRVPEAQECMEQALVLSEAAGDRRSAAVLTANMGFFLHFRGRFADAREHLDRGIAMIRKFNDPGNEANAVGNLGNVSFDEGRLIEARDQFDQQLALSRQIGDRYLEAEALTKLGRLWLALGRADRAMSETTESLRIFQEIGDRYGQIFTQSALVAIADEQGDSPAALARAFETVAWRRTLGAGGVGAALVHLGDLLRRDGDFEGARSALEQSVPLNRSEGRAVQVVFACAVLACLPGGDAAPAETALREAGDAANTARVRFLLWQATRDPTHLSEAKRLLDFLVAHAPADCRESMVTNVRLHREIAAAAATELPAS